MVKIFKISYFLFLLGFVIFVTITSCNKQDASLNAPNTVDVAQSQFKLENVKLENGMLVFNSRADFETARYTVQKGQQTISEWLYAQFPSFNSQVKALKALSHQDSLNILNSTTVPSEYAGFARKDRNEGVDFVSRVIETLIYGNLVNKEGFVAYADSVFKITYDNVYGMSKADYLKSPNQDFTKSITGANVHAIGHNIVFQKEKTDASFRWNIDWFSEPITYQSMNDRQWTCILYVSNYWWDHSVEVTTRYEMYGGGGVSTSFLSVSAAFKTNAFDPNPNAPPGTYKSYFISYSSGSGSIWANAINIPNGEDVINWNTNHGCIDQKGTVHYHSMYH